MICEKKSKDYNYKIGGEIIKEEKNEKNRWTPLCTEWFKKKIKYPILILTFIE